MQTESAPRRRVGRRMSAARERVLRAVADLGARNSGAHDGDSGAPPGWVSLEQVAEHLGGHPNTSRQQLTALADDDMVEISTFPTGRPGRRPQGFRATSRGWAALADHDQVNEYRDLVGAFATFLVQDDQHRAPEKARAIGRIWGDQQAEQLPEFTHPTDHQPLDGLVEVLDMLGFSPTRVATEQGETLTLGTCPLIDLAESHPNVICEMHQGMIDAVLHNLGAREGVELLPMADAEGCRVQPRGRGA
ncbi:helix-turn-helix transcriptional regulator [Propionibacteriaceae bacterium Y1923]|uniref:helix-turn-helix transcriptional regulator n=1 Tax=Aestuariimicrobium sp. Y1814 TaxID=3418742 RepID=UPI003C150431